MVGDRIANLINGITNAQARGQKTVDAPYTKLVMEIAELLKKEGYVTDVEKHGKDIRKKITIELKYDENGVPAITGTKRVSKQSARVYKRVNEIHSVKSGFGTIVFSTPAGLLTDKQARKANVGGEALFEIW